MHGWDEIDKQFQANQESAQREAEAEQRKAEAEATRIEWERAAAVSADRAVSYFVSAAYAKGAMASSWTRRDLVHIPKHVANTVTDVKGTYELKIFPDGTWVFEEHTSYYEDGDFKHRTSRVLDGPISVERAEELSRINEQIQQLWDKCQRTFGVMPIPLHRSSVVRKHLRAFDELLAELDRLSEKSSSLQRGTRRRLYHPSENRRREDKTYIPFLSDVELAAFRYLMVALLRANDIPLPSGD